MGSLLHYAKPEASLIRCQISFSLLGTYRSEARVIGVGPACAVCNQGPLDMRLCGGGPTMHQRLQVFRMQANAMSASAAS